MNKEEQIKEWFKKTDYYSLSILKTISNYKDLLKKYSENWEKIISIPMYKRFISVINLFNSTNIDNSEVYLLILDISYLFGVIIGSQKMFFTTLRETIIKKNRDYGSSFDKSVNKFGWIYVAIELDKKKNRLHSLLKNKEKPNYESIEDTLLDIAGYCVLSLIYLENKGAKQ